MKNRKPQVLTLRGIAKRNSLHLKDFDFTSGQIKSAFLVLPALRLSRKWNVANPLHAYSRISRYKSFLILISRANLLFLGFRWVGITIEVNLEKHEINRIHQEFYEWTQSKNVYISREIGFLGFRLSKFDLSLDYDLFRNLHQFDIVITSASFTYESLVYETGSSLEIAELTPKIIGFFNNTYIPVAIENPISFQKSNLPELNSNLVVRGELNKLGSDQLSEVLVDESFAPWKYEKFNQAIVFHGLLVQVKNEFYLSDPNRYAEWGSAFNFIPSIIFQGFDKTWMTPRPNLLTHHIKEAIFVGGTNNLMHTVLEDVTRLVLAEFLGLHKSIPIIISDLLSPQIIDLLRVISRREILAQSHYSRLTVETLHFFQFDSPLPAIMKGDYTKSSQLFPSIIAHTVQTILAESRGNRPLFHNRILILREPGLFRPLTNLELVKKILINEFNFKAYYLSKMDFESVAELFGNSNLIVGEYGAGLANAIHMLPGGKVIEIRGPLEKKACEYEVVVKALGLNHSLLFGKSRLISKYGISRGPFAISIRELRNLLNEVIRD